MEVFSNAPSAFPPRRPVIGGQEYCLRRADRDDIYQILLLEKEVYQGQLPWSQKIFAKELRRRDSLYLLLYFGNYLVGMVGCRFRFYQAHITYLAVVPQLQGRGLGTYLLTVILNEVKKQDLNKVTLEVRVENKKAQALYRHLGFRDNFIRRNYYTNVDRPDSDGLNMICDLRKKNYLE